MLPEVTGVINPSIFAPCACDYVKECESIDHDWNILEITEITTQMLSIWHHSKQKAHVLPS